MSGGETVNISNEGNTTDDVKDGTGLEEHLTRADYRSEDFADGPQSEISEITGALKEIVKSQTRIESMLATKLKSNRVNFNQSECSSVTLEGKRPSIRLSEFKKKEFDLVSLDMHDQLTSDTSSLCSLSSGEDQRCINYEWLGNLQVLPNYATVPLPQSFLSSNSKGPLVSGTRSFNSMPSEKDDRRWTMIDPNCTCKIIFDLASILILFYDLVTIPVMLAWDVKETDHSRFMVVFTAGFWTVDMVLSFRCGYFDSNGRLEMRPTKVAKNYVFGNFLIDSLTVGSDWICWFFLFQNSQGPLGDNDGALNMLRLTKLKRWLRIISMARVFRLFEVVDRLAENFGLDQQWTVTWNVTKILFAIVWVNHVVTCFWIAVGRHGHSDTGFSWLDMHIGNGVTVAEAPVAYQYSTAFHWAVTQMTPGSVQVNPKNTQERMFASICLLGGMLFFGALVSTLSTTIVQYRLGRRTQTENRRLLNKFLTDESVDTSLIVQVNRQIQIKLLASKRKSLSVNEIVVLDLLSKPLRMEVDYHLYSPRLFKHPLFRYIDESDPSAIPKLCNEAINWETVPPHDMITVLSNPATEAKYIKSGVAIYERPEDVLQHVEPEEVPLHTWTCEVAWFCSWHYVGTMEAIGVVEVLSVSASSIARLFQSPVLKRFGAYYAQGFCEAIRNATFPSDIVMPGVEFGQLVLRMPAQTRRMVSHVALHSFETSLQQGVFKRNLSPDLYEQAAGDTTFITSANGQPERVSAVSVLKLARADGAIFVQLGEIKEEEVLQCCCRLPGTKEQSAETPTQSVERLVQEDLPAFAGNLNYLQSFSEVSRSAAARDGIHTKYYNTVHYARLTNQNVADKLRLLREKGTQMSMQPNASEYPDNSTSSIQSVFAVGRKVVKFYAWMTEREFDVLSADGGKRKVLSLLSRLKYASGSDDDETSKVSEESSVIEEKSDSEKDVIENRSNSAHDRGFNEDGKSEPFAPCSSLKIEDTGRELKNSVDISL